MARTAKTNLKVRNAGLEIAGSFDTIDLLTGLSGADQGLGVVGFTGSAGSSAPTIPVESPDGSRTTFTFATKPKWVSVDGVNKFETTNWSYSGTTLTVTDGAPPVNSMVGFL